MVVWNNLDDSIVCAETAKTLRSSLLSNFFFKCSPSCLLANRQQLGSANVFYQEDQDQTCHSVRLLMTLPAVSSLAFHSSPSEFLVYFACEVDTRGRALTQTKYLILSLFIYSFISWSVGQVLFVRVVFSLRGKGEKLDQR